MVQLSVPGDQADPYPWVVLGLSLNVAEHPPNPEPERFNSIHDSGTPEVSVEALLEGFSRHFLAWINRWAEEGFEPARKAWALRADGIDEPVTLILGGDKLTGRMKGINDRGEAVLERDDGTMRVISVAEYFGLGEAMRSDD
jgi:BirA family biotin operon repressor/biotin-[acetyl-CoA-carboxylase] ligase